MTRHCKMTFNRITGLLFLGAALTCAASCIYVDDNLGKNFVPSNQIYEIRTATLPLDCIEMEPSDSLSAYSSSRITVGAVRDGIFGLTKRSSAFTVVPVDDTIDVGTNTRIRQFHFTFAKDTVSCSDPWQKTIIQNVNVYELEKTLDSTFNYTFDLKDADFAGKTKIASGTPTYNGGDSLSFDMSAAYAQKYVDLFKEDPDIQLDLTEYLNRMPGIYMNVDAPLNDGGRINMFRVSIDITDSYYVTGNYAELKITADYGTRENVDTSFLFYFGPAERTSTTSQYAFNVSSTESVNIKPDPDNAIYIEGGPGYKPVVKAEKLRTAILAELAKTTDRNGNPLALNPDDVIINKARLIFPYEFESTDRMSLYPAVLSPTCKISKEITPDEGEPYRYVTYAGLTDASVDSENQGDINRSLCCYTPDVSHHVQSIIRLKDDAAFTDYDIWMLVMAYETTQSSSSSSSDLSDYYQNLAYLNYYNNLYGDYGYGYGSYGYGYGYGSYGYDNYYNYYLASMYASSSSSSSSSSTTLMLDKDRYYAAEIKGMSDSDGPRIELVYSYTVKDLE
ncbi:MAG: hypothetical protein ACI395_01275 [Candidatus Cryptobacteroides sp.]